jgi:sulfonate transport system substrate-binding protein
VSLADLRGKRIAFQKGSSAHYLVLRALVKAGLRFSDIQPVYLVPADARAAFENHSIDAWAIWDPYWAAAARGTRLKVLSTAVGIADDDTFYEASREFVDQHPAEIELIFAALNEADRYVLSRQEEAAGWVAAATGLDPEAARTFLERRSDSPVNLLNPSGIAKQQAVADSFETAGLLPRKINVAEVVWHPKQTLPSAAAR